MSLHDETEADTRAERIDPVLWAAGWGVVDGSRVRREMICPGRIQAGGKRGKGLSCDYVLFHKGQKLAVLEAKRAGLSHREGVGQAKDYAGRLGARFAYASNGLHWYGIDMATGAEGDFDLPFPTPDELWERTFAEPNPWRDAFGAVEFETDGGKWEARYYQHKAIAAALEAIAQGERRILLTLATGTGKTSIAFQIAWKLFHAKWSLAGEPARRPRILFLADRNILADQAYNAFSAFPPDAVARIDPRLPPQEARQAAEERQRLLHHLPDLHDRRGHDRRGRAGPHRLSARLFRLRRDRRMPPRRRPGRKRVARHPGAFRARGAARPHGDAQAPAQCRHLRLFRRAGLHLRAPGTGSRTAT